MAGKIPLFASAPRCKITIGGQPVAYAIGLNMSVSVQIQEVRILGEFAIQSLEPVSYAPVTGSIQIVRLLGQTVIPGKAAIPASGSVVGVAATPDTTDQITASNKFSTQLQGTQISDADGLQKVTIQNSVTGTANFSQTTLLAHLDPKKVLLSQSFDIEIFLKAPASAADDAPDVEVAFMGLIDCRLVGSSMNIAPGQLLTQSLEFQGLLMINRARGSKFLEAPDTSVTDG